MPATSTRTKKTAAATKSTAAPRASAVDVVKLDKLAASVAALRRVQARRKKLEAEESRHIKAIKEAMGDAQQGTVAGEPAVRWSVSTRSTVSIEQVKEKFPDVAAACTKLITVRTFQLVQTP